MAFKFNNNAASTVANNPLAAAGTTLTVASGHGDRFPAISGTDVAYLTLSNGAGSVEIVKVTARAGGSDSMTIVRAQEGTTAIEWALGSTVEQRVTAGTLTRHEAIYQIYEATAKSSLASNDLVGVLDSAASYVLKQTSVENIQTYCRSVTANTNGEARGYTVTNSSGGAAAFASYGVVTDAQTMLVLGLGSGYGGAGVLAANYFGLYTTAPGGLVLAANGGSLKFSAGGLTEVMGMTSSAINCAQNLVMSVGKGVDFSATSDGPTMTSEVFDDYEEGTWAPADTSGAGLSITVTFATYTKIGNVIYCHLDITYPVTADGRGASLSLPATALANGQYTIWSGYHAAGTFAVMGSSNSGTANLFIRDYNTGAQKTNAQCSANRFILTGFYYA